MCRSCFLCEVRWRKQGLWGGHVLSPLPCIGNILSPRVVFLPVAFVLALAAACGGAPEGAASRSCGQLEDVTDRTGLISRSEAEELATEQLAMSAPEVSETQIEKVWASCLTTLRSYEQDLLGRKSWANPGVQPPDTPVWIVEVKGISRPAGISTATASDHYRYAMAVINARTADPIFGSRRYEPMMEPSP